MMSREAVVAAGAAALRAVDLAERVSLIWEWPGMAISFNWDQGRWFWVAFDRKAGRVAGCGRAATIEAAVDQAKAATRSPMLAAE